MSNSPTDRRAIIGVFIILIGVFLLLRNFDLIPFFIPGFLFSWWSLFILAGLFALGNRENKTPGFILIAVGTINLLPEIFGISHHQAWSTFWPVILVVIGLSFILRRRVQYTKDTGATFNSYGGPGQTMDAIDEVAIFGGGERVITSSSFRGGRITTIFGGLEINLLNCDLAPGNNVIDVFTIFGGSEFIVPADWNVKSEVVALFGGFNDKRRFMNDPITNPENTLIVRGFVLFGGGEIKNISMKRRA